MLSRGRRDKGKTSNFLLFFPDYNCPFPRYVAWTGDYETGNGDEPETLVQKYQRLNCEVRELLDEVEKAKESDKDDGKPGQNLAAIAMQASQLQGTLANLKLEETLGSELIKRLDDPTGATKDKLMLQLEALKGTAASSTGEAKKTPTTTSGEPLTYELLMKPETAKLNEQKHIAELDKRLENLEKLLAYSPDKMVSIVHRAKIMLKSTTSRFRTLSLAPLPFLHQTKLLRTLTRHIQASYRTNLIVSTHILFFLTKIELRFPETKKVSNINCCTSKSSSSNNFSNLSFNWP